MPGPPPTAPPTPAPGGSTPGLPTPTGLPHSPAPALAAPGGERAGPEVHPPPDSTSRTQGREVEEMAEATPARAQGSTRHRPLKFMGATRVGGAPVTVWGRGGRLGMVCRAPWGPPSPPLADPARTGDIMMLPARRGMGCMPEGVTLTPLASPATAPSGPPACPAPPTGLPAGPWALLLAGVGTSTGAGGPAGGPGTTLATGPLPVSDTKGGSLCGKGSLGPMPMPTPPPPLLPPTAALAAEPTEPRLEACRARPAARDRAVATCSPTPDTTCTTPSPLLLPPAGS